MLFRWLQENGFMLGRGSTKPRTHTLMSGGIIGVPDEEYPVFLDLYSREMGRNKKLSFSELRSAPVFRMFFDVDLVDDVGLGEDFVVTMSRTIQAVSRSYYREAAGLAGDDRTFLCVVCTTEPKAVTKDGKELTKNGFHVVLPFLRVDLEIAYQIRFNVVYELERVMGKRAAPSNPWADAIDKAPYTGGLKMCGSFKMVRCTRCDETTRKKEEERADDDRKELTKEIARLRRELFPRDRGFDYKDLSTIDDRELKEPTIYLIYGKLEEASSAGRCQDCNGRRKCLETRTYAPTMVLDSDGTNNTEIADELSRDGYKAMVYTSIRCQGDEAVTPGFKRPENVPLCPDESNRASLSNVDRKTLRAMGESEALEVMSGGVFKRDEDGVLSWAQKGPQVYDQVVLSTIETFLRGLNTGPYGKIQVKTVVEHEIRRTVSAGKISPGERIVRSIVQGGGASQAVEDKPVSVERSLLVRVAGEGSTFCANKGGYHTSNSIYFRITPESCFQKCFSRKEEVRSGGNKPCGSYRSVGVDLPRSVGRVLFPEVLVSEPPTSTMAFSDDGPRPSDWTPHKKRKLASPWGARYLRIR